MGCVHLSTFQKVGVKGCHDIYLCLFILNSFAFSWQILNGQSWMYIIIVIALLYNLKSVHENFISIMYANWVLVLEYHEKCLPAHGFKMSMMVHALLTWEFIQVLCCLIQLNISRECSNCCYEVVVRLYINVTFQSAKIVGQ